MIRKAKSSYNRRIRKKIQMIPRTFWKLWRKSFPTNRLHLNHQPLVESITVNGKTTTHALTIANGFCSRFCINFTNVVEKLLSNIPPLNWNQLSSEACLYNSSQSLLSLKPVSAAFVNRQLRLLKTSQGTGRNSSPSPSISASAVVSEELKYARVVSLY